MSGHNKWQQIRHKKGISDQKKGQIFSKLAKIISIASRDGADPENNPKLKSAIEKARFFNMPNDNIEKAIKKVSDKASELEELTIEAIAPGGVSVIINAISDNKNRTIAEIKNILAKHEAKMTESGSIGWMFDHQGVIRIIPEIDLENKKLDQIEESLELKLIEAGADDIKKEDDTIVVYTKPEKLDEIKNNIINAGLVVESSQLELYPKTEVKIDDGVVKEKLNKLFEALDEHDDVQEIYSNEI